MAYCNSRCFYKRVCVPARRVYPYRRRWRRRASKRSRTSLVKRLDYTAQPFVCNIFGREIPWAFESASSSVQRICPMGTGSSSTTPANWHASLVKCDPRFVQLCALYNELQIRSIYIEIVLNHHAGMNITSVQNADHPDLTSRTVLVGRIIRDCQYGTVLSSADDILYTSGSVASKCRTFDSYPRLTFTIRPRTSDERSQWIPTPLAGNNIAYWVANHVYFAPAIDFFAYNTDGPSQTTAQSFKYSFNVICRYNVAFRNAKQQVPSNRYPVDYRQAIPIALAQAPGLVEEAKAFEAIPGGVPNIENPVGADGLTETVRASAGVTNRMVDVDKEAVTVIDPKTGDGIVVPQDRRGLREAVDRGLRSVGLPSTGVLGQIADDIRAGDWGGAAASAGAALAGAAAMYAAGKANPAGGNVKYK